MSSDLPPVGAEGTSTRPYLIRALHEWCTDNGLTPFLAVRVGPGVRVPMEYVKNHEIVLNAGFEATSDLSLGNESISFKARFGGVPREIFVPVVQVAAIYARENGQGMAFPVLSTAPDDLGEAQRAAPPSDKLASPDGKPPRGGARLAVVGAEGASKPEWAQLETANQADAPTLSGAGSEPPLDPTPSPPSGRPALKRIK